MAGTQTLAQLAVSQAQLAASHAQLEEFCRAELAAQRADQQRLCDMVRPRSASWQQLQGSFLQARTGGFSVSVLRILFFSVGEKSSLRSFCAQ